jgi:hypothetical protein
MTLEVVGDGWRELLSWHGQGKYVCSTTEGRSRRYRPPAQQRLPRRRMMTFVGDGKRRAAVRALRCQRAVNLMRTASP